MAQNPPRELHPRSPALLHGDADSCCGSQGVQAGVRRSERWIPQSPCAACTSLSHLAGHRVSSRALTATTVPAHLWLSPWDFRTGWLATLTALTHLGPLPSQTALGCYFIVAAYTDMHGRATLLPPRSRGRYGWMHAHPLFFASLKRTPSPRKAISPLDDDSSTHVCISSTVDAASVPPGDKLELVRPIRGPLVLLVIDLPLPHICVLFSDDNDHHALRPPARLSAVVRPLPRLRSTHTVPLLSAACVAGIKMVRNPRRAAGQCHRIRSSVCLG
jgi:hypothetical protein